MTTKNETIFTKLVNSKLNPSVYYEKTNNPFRYGMPDLYYEGPRDILWVEYKWIEKPWTKDLDPSQICPRKEWTHQRHWLERAHKNKKRAWTIVGVGLGKKACGYILEFPFNFDVDDNYLFPVEFLARIIDEAVI